MTAAGGWRVDGDPRLEGRRFFGRGLARVDDVPLMVGTGMVQAFVSVVVPAYNSAWSIPDTLASVLRQTHCNIELIIVDDGSTDGLADVIAPALQDPRTRLVRQENAGLAAARNRGLAESAGDLVAFVDADDIWHPQFLERVIGALDADPAAPFGYALFRRIDTENRMIPTPLWRHVPRHDFVGLIEVNTVGNGSAMVFRRAAILAAGGFDSGLRDQGAQGAEDWKLLLMLAARHPPAIVRRQLVGYRQVAGGMSRGQPDTQLRAVRTVIAQIRRMFPATPERHFRNARTVMNGWLLPAFLAAGRRSEALEMLWESYVLNPLWFLSRDVRTIHLHKLASAVQGMRSRVQLADLVEDGERPFAFLRAPADPEAQDTNPGGRL
jgi:glycosyltransferase involved in cell wall biosynthesis